MVNFLIKHGADVAKKADRGYTALNYAIASKNVEIAKILLDNGADLNAKISIYNATPLMHAISVYNLKMVKLLLKYGAKVTKKEIEFAKKRGSDDILQILKKYL